MSLLGDFLEVAFGPDDRCQQASRQIDLPAACWSTSVIDFEEPPALYFAKHTLRDMTNDLLPPHFPSPVLSDPNSELRVQVAEAVSAWLTRSPSAETRSGYARELNQFLR